MNVIKPGSLGVIFPSWMHILALPILRNTLADWAIYFPLGLVYGLHSKTMLPWLKRWFFWLLIATLFFFFIGMLDANRILQFPVARFICQTTFVLAIPAITRDRIPIVRQLEKIGKRSYGLYLSHLIVIDMSLLVLQNTVQWLIGIHVLLFPVLFLLGLLIPLGIMEIASRSPIKAGYRYVFG
jgi:peptidoglycan/LPS O-acetylase OafA/YrhL